MREFVRRVRPRPDAAAVNPGRAKPTQNQPERVVRDEKRGVKYVTPWKGSIAVRYDRRTLR